MMKNILNLPERTIFNKKIPKIKFYEKFNINNKLKKKFVSDIESIVWKYKLSKETINIESTEEVEEIQIFEINLKHKNIDDKILEQIDKCIPYHIFFILLFNSEISTAIAYKKRNLKDANKFVIDSYYMSDWINIEKYKFDLPAGLNLQTIYENLIKNLIGKNSDENIEAVIEKEKYYNQIKSEILLLEFKIKKEKYFKRKVKMNIELQTKKKELEMLSQ